MRKRYTMGLISSNRAAIYGLSILWIMFFHATINCTGPIGELKSLGNMGVDIFLFVSGISLYFSLVKGISFHEFYLKRFQRVVIPTMLVCIPWFFLLFLRNKDFASFAFNSLGVGLFYNGDRTIWFVTAICICYLIYPFVFSFFRKMNWTVYALLPLLAGSIFINIVLRLSFAHFWKNSEILWRRIPVFLIGSYCGKHVYENKETAMSSPGIILLSGLMLLFQYGCRVSGFSSYVSMRYIYIPMAVSFTFLLSIIGNLRVVKKLGTWFSPITLEIYLLHEKIIKIISKIIPSGNPVLQNLLAACSSIVCAYVLLAIEKKLISAFSKRR